MTLRKATYFLFQSVTVGLAVAFLVFVWKPELLDSGRRVVAIVEQAVPSHVSLSTNGPVSYADAVATAAPAVVNIFTRKRVAEAGHPLFDDPIFRHFFGERMPAPREREETSLGSGVIVSPEGYILTNNHVIEAAEAIEVALQDGRKIDATVVGSDPEADLAVLRITTAELPAITLGQSDALRVGDVVLAIGNPFGVGQTVTLGIVSATGRTELGISTFENFIQTDAAINPGNSGGALITARGELVGINTAIFSRTGGSQGIGFAIPVSLAKGIMTQIIETGHVSRGWLGIEIQEISRELAESFGLPSRDGVIVAGVLRDGPAARAGIRPGDVLTRVGEQPIRSVRGALDAISQTRPGSTIGIAGMREGEAFRREVTVARRPAQAIESSGKR